jgi:hypothetical protein
MVKTTQQKIVYEQMSVGYEFVPSNFRLNAEKMKAFLNAVDDNNRIYEDNKIVPPMAIAALAMAEMALSLSLPLGAIHVTQNLEFLQVARIGDQFTSHASVSRKLERDKFHMLTISINVQNQHHVNILSGETSFILPLAATEEKQ